MISKAKTPEAYLAELPPERKEVVAKLRQVILDNLPEGFEETMNYGMIGYVVPHSIYPGGYHCTPEMPLPFMSLASQKNHIGFYHMGIYAEPKLMEWFTSEYPKHSSRKLDMGKSCIRFKNMRDIPYALLGKLVGKMSVDEWITRYEKNIKR
ncbi:MAG: DUF1801 domain-containing protein [Flavobacteriaceae bacterium]|nr:DUF1801 domain-containing protein [Eudoraea sp.]NNJ39063.1 DUF1801 domain-containing protein [Flavobacteriaceae bacterium]